MSGMRVAATPGAGGGGGIKPPGSKEAADCNCVGASSTEATAAIATAGHAAMLLDTVSEGLLLDAGATGAWTSDGGEAGVTVSAAATLVPGPCPSGGGGGGDSEGGGGASLGGGTFGAC